MRASGGTAPMTRLVGFDSIATAGALDIGPGCLSKAWRSLRVVRSPCSLWFSTPLF